MSLSLKTQIKIKSVDFSLFNKFILEEVIVRDKKNDTLLFAGEVKVRITDWFFFKDDITLHYIGLKKGFIHINRIDSTWNHQFILDALLR